MILVDANLLLYATLSSYDEHARARLWLDTQLSGADPVGLPWTSLLAFLRIASNPRIFPRPLPMADAWAQVKAWRAQPCVFSPEPGPNHGEILDQLMATTAVTTRLVTDAHLAALAIGHGLRLCSADADFARFPALRWMNPLDD